jgi:hypothetical protein
VQTDEIRFAKELFGRHKLEPEFALDGRVRAGGVVIEHPHRKSARAARHGLPDTAHAEDSHGSMMDVLAHQQINGPLAPLAVPHETIRLHSAACGGYQQREGEVGGGVNSSKVSPSSAAT